MAFASYEGGAGCTTVARAVAQELARFRGKRVLYLSLEDVDSSEEFVTVPAGIRREDELLYRLLGRGKTPFLESYLVRDAFDVCALAPAAGRNPLRELDGQDMELLLATLMDSGMFDVIVADLSTCLTEAAAAVMEPAGRICLITKGTGGSRERSYRNQIAGFGKEIPDKVVRAVNRASGTEEAANGTFYIRKAEEDQVDGAPLEGEFGRDISKLTEAMLNVVE